VRPFNDADVDHGVIRRATEEAAWLLQSVCVAVEWVPCTTVSVSHPESCTLPVPSIELHLLPSPTTSDVAGSVLGIAFPRLGTRGNGAVFLSHITQLVAANAGVIDVSRFMGHVLAHEIGHLLLNSSAHSSDGLMRAGFRRRDLERATQRRLTFTPAQNDTIRRLVLARQPSASGKAFVSGDAHDFAIDRTPPSRPERSEYSTGARPGPVVLPSSNLSMASRSSSSSLRSSENRFQIYLGAPNGSRN
jgi:hypothetical protein